jgi:hypothetical protein
VLEMILVLAKWAHPTLDLPPCEGRWISILRSTTKVNFPERIKCRLIATNRKTIVYLDSATIAGDVAEGRRERCRLPNSRS